MTSIRSSAPSYPLQSLFAAAAFVVTVDARVITPLLPALASEFRVDVAQAGLVVTAYTLPYGLMQLLYGPLGDRFGKLRVFSATLALFAFGTAACALAPSFDSMVLLRVLTGAVAAGAVPLIFAQIGDAVAYERRQATIAQILGATSLGTLFSMSIGGLFADLISWRGLFLLSGSIAAIVSLLLWRVILRGGGVARPARVNAKASTSSFALLKQASARQVYLGAFLEGAFFHGAFAFSGAFLRERFDLAYLLIGLSLSGLAIGGLVYSRVVRQLLGRLGEHGMMLVGGLAISAGLAALAVLPRWELAAPLSFVLGLGFFMIHNTLQTRATALSESARATAISLFAFSLFSGQAVGAILTGQLIANLGYSSAFFISSLSLALLACWLAWSPAMSQAGARRPDRRAADEPAG